MSLYAQQGHGKSDKIETGIEDGNIHGVILSPKNEQPEKLEYYVSQLRVHYPKIDILFDPQFYISTMIEGKKTGHLLEYQFFPGEVIGKNFLSTPKNVQNIVKTCFDYQSRLGINRFISPSIIIDSFESRWSQISISLCNESMQQISSYGTEKELLLTICVDENSFKNFVEVRDFLDTISLFDVKGFYLVIDRISTENPLLISPDILGNIMFFCYNLSTINGFEVILGYTDCIGIPLYSTGIASICTGWYNTQRRFSSTDYIPRTGGRRPSKRYFSNKILNSLVIVPEIQLLSDNGKLQEILSRTKYDRALLSDLSGANWHDNISSLHYWESMNQLLLKIDDNENCMSKLEYVESIIHGAKVIYNNLRQDIFDVKSRSTHLESWTQAIAEFKEKIT